MIIVGDTFECGHCKPDKYAKSPACNCVCHGSGTSHHDSWEPELKKLLNLGAPHQIVIDFIRSLLEEATYRPMITTSKDKADALREALSTYKSELRKKLEGMKIKPDRTCTHYQDNCSCYTSRDCQFRNDTIAAAINLLDN